jgi:hypothetical protein
MAWYNWLAPVTNFIPGLSPFMGKGGPAGGKAGGYDPATGLMLQPTNDKNMMANFLQSTENKEATTGASTLGKGLKGAESAQGALGPVMSYLSALTRGDQADISQAIQPEANRIRDSFSAVRNMISGQPRGGGKTSSLAESGFQQERQIGDTAAALRSKAPGELGSLALGLAGQQLGEAQLGAELMSRSQEIALGQRGQNVGPGSFASQFNQISQGISALV